MKEEKNRKRKKKSGRSDGEGKADIENDRQTLFSSFITLCTSTLGHPLTRAIDPPHLQ
jgi:hypothetical protein